MSLPIKQKLIYLIRLPLIFILFLYQDIFSYFKRKKLDPSVRLDDKVALVTGANRGIGKQIAIELVSRGAKVILACRSLESATKTASEIAAINEVETDQLIPLALDLGSFASIKSACAQLNTCDHLDILINNAGVVGRAEKTFTVDGLEETCQINFVAPFLLTQLLLPLLKKSSHARVVMVTSEFNLLPYKFHKKLFTQSSDQYNALINYSLSKFALNGYVIKMSQMLVGTNVKIHAVHPGCVKTNLVSKESSLATRISNSSQQFIRGVSIETGAQAPCYVAIEPTISALNGQYFVAGHIFKPNKRLMDDKVLDDIWNFANQAIHQECV